MSWIEVKDEKPADGQKVFYFFPFLGVYKGNYKRTQYPQEMFEEDTEPVYGDTFYSDRGFLTDDVTHWKDATDVHEDYMPDVPEGYILIGDGRFTEWALEEETVRITKYEYDMMKERLDYLVEGHLEGLVCQEGCPIHIYWTEDDNGYKCGGCGKVYSTEEVESNPDKYKESTYVYKGLE